MVTRSCPECGAVAGETHWPDCSHAAHLHPSQTLREGDCMAAVSECRHRGWAAAYVDGEGFRPCSPDEPGAYADIDRWLYWREHGDDVLAGFDSAGDASPSHE